MNSIKSLLGLLSLVLTILVYPLSAEAQNIAIPPGTSTSVKLLGQIYIETGNQAKRVQDIDILALFAEKTAERYADRIDITTTINDSDRRYLSKCFMYSVEQILRCTFRLKGVDPEDPEIAPYVKQEITNTKKLVEGKIAKAQNVGEIVEALEKIQ